MTSAASTIPPHDYGVVAVVDGKSLKLTPLRTANIPPPMSLYELTLEHNAVDIAFNTSCSKMAVLHSESISVFTMNPKHGFRKPPTLIFSKSITFDHERGAVQQVVFTGDSSLIYLQSSANGSVLHYMSGSDSGWDPCRKMCIEPRQITHIFSSMVDNQVCLQTSAGSIIKIKDVEQSSNETMNIARLPPRTFWVVVADIDEAPVAFGLSANGALYANARVLSKNCTSFIVTSAHLILTTTNHLLKFIHLSSLDGKK